MKRSTTASRRSSSIRTSGNAYNDIGVYLMQKGQLDEAIAWLEQAKLAKALWTPTFSLFQ